MKRNKVVPLLVVVSICSFANDIHANVIAVTANSSNGNTSFSVTLSSTETGCEQYADWWEVLSKSGELLYRRILVHSHPTTQPFTRSGRNVGINENDVVYVRAHMNTVGYVGTVMKGSVTKGFKKVTKLPIFSKKLENQSPLPKECLF